MVNSCNLLHASQNILSAGYLALDASIFESALNGFLMDGRWEIHNTTQKLSKPAR